VSYLPIIGALSLGIVVGWLVRYFIRRFKSFTPKVLGSVVTAAIGGAVIRFLEHDTNVWWFYPIGLLLGFVVYSIVAVSVGAPMEGVLYTRSSSFFRLTSEA
jgi:uncharacterized membrane protein